jgi:hypothetical protein
VNHRRRYIVIRLEVHYLGGNYTLVCYDTGASMSRDCGKELHANPDAHSFYRAAAQYITTLAGKGQPFTYQEATEDELRSR